MQLKKPSFWVSNITVEAQRLNQTACLLFSRGVDVFYGKIKEDAEVSNIVERISTSILPIFSHFNCYITHCAPLPTAHSRSEDLIVDVKTLAALLTLVMSSGALMYSAFTATSLCIKGWRMYRFFSRIPR